MSKMSGWVKRSVSGKQAGVRREQQVVKKAM